MALDRKGVKLFWSAEDEAYICICTLLPSISGCGETPLEAVQEWRVAWSLAMEALHDYKNT